MENNGNSVAPPNGWKPHPAMLQVTVTFNPASGDMSHFFSKESLNGAPLPLVMNMMAVMQIQSEKIVDELSAAVAKATGQRTQSIHDDLRVLVDGMKQKQNGPKLVIPSGPLDNGRLRGLS